MFVWINCIKLQTICQFGLLLFFIKYGCCHGPRRSSILKSRSSTLALTTISTSTPSELRYTTTSAVLVSTDDTNQSIFGNSDNYVCHHNGSHWLVDIATWCRNQTAWYEELLTTWLTITSAGSSNNGNLDGNAFDGTTQTTLNSGIMTNKPKRPIRFHLYKMLCLHQMDPSQVSNNRSWVIVNSTLLVTTKNICNFGFNVTGNTDSEESDSKVEPRSSGSVKYRNTGAISSSTKKNETQTVTAKTVTVTQTKLQKKNTTTVLLYGETAGKRNNASKPILFIPCSHLISSERV
ncbi:hypothetical protein CHUAL_000787 [Chamberlinius hualienensis]